jgi:hypothetical protein
MLNDSAVPRVLTSYREFASALVGEGILSDPWVDGAPRFRMTPLTIDRATQARLYEAAEGIAAAHAEAARLCAATPALVDRFFRLPPAYRAMWELSIREPWEGSRTLPRRTPLGKPSSVQAYPAWHGIARADVFLTADGARVCELNSDTPSGQAEATALGRLVDGAGAAFLDDPNRALEARVAGLVEAAHARVAAATGAAAPRTVGIVYPTEISDDLCVIELYARWFTARGFRVVLGSPFNLRPDGAGGVALFGAPCPVIWRHYKTDWWGERRPVRRSEPRYADDAPLSGPLALLAGAVARCRCEVVNPFGAVLTQNKRMMALMWEAIDLFSPPARAIIRRFLPFTARLERLSTRRLAERRVDWVLKSDYGCEGDEVVIGAETTPEAWARAIADARPARWIAQRRFQALPLGAPCARAATGAIANYGVYVVGGRAAGLFTRLQRGATDHRAVVAPTLVRRW